MVAQLVVRLQFALGLNSLNVFWTVLLASQPIGLHVIPHAMSVYALNVPFYVSRQNFNPYCASGSSYTRRAQSYTGPWICVSSFRS